jgi:hypothetical protein
MQAVRKDIAAQEAWVKVGEDLIAWSSPCSISLRTTLVL